MGDTPPVWPAIEPGMVVDKMKELHDYLYPPEDPDRAWNGADTLEGVGHIVQDALPGYLAHKHSDARLPEAGDVVWIEPEATVFVVLPGWEDPRGYYRIIGHDLQERTVARFPSHDLNLRQAVRDDGKRRAWEEV